MARFSGFLILLPLLAGCSRSSSHSAGGAGQAGSAGSGGQGSRLGNRAGGGGATSGGRVGRGGAMPGGSAGTGGADAGAIGGSGGAVGTGGTWAGLGGAPTSARASKVDLFFMIDNSISMADKQQVLADSLPYLIARMATPDCL